MMMAVTMLPPKVPARSASRTCTANCAGISGPSAPREHSPTRSSSGYSQSRIQPSRSPVHITE